MRSGRMTGFRSFRRWDLEGGETQPSEALMPDRVLFIGHAILEAGISADLLMGFVLGLTEVLEHYPADVLMTKLQRLMKVAEGDILEKKRQEREAIRTRESTRKYRAEKRKEEQRKRLEERHRLQEEKIVQALQITDNDSTG